MAVSSPPARPFWSRPRAIYATSAPPKAPSRQKWAIWQQERTFLLPTSTSNGRAEQSHSSNVNSASFRRRQGVIPPATLGAEQGLRWSHLPRRPESCPSSQLFGKRSSSLACPL